MSLGGIRLRDLQGALIVFCCGLAVTAFLAYHLAGIERERDWLDFERHATSAQDAVLDRVQTSIAVLRGTAALVAATGPSLTAQAFQSYAQRLGLTQFYPGVQGLGWSRSVLPFELPALVQHMHEQGYADFQVWPAGERAQYNAIQYLEPLDERNRAALGFDMASEEARAAAMARACDTGLPAATTRVSLVQEITEQKQPGLLIYVPVYRGGYVPKTVESRRAALLGHVYAPLRARDFISQAFLLDKYPNLTARIYDGTRRDPGALLFERAAVRGSAEEPRFVRTATIDVAGTPWTLVFESGNPSRWRWVTYAVAPVSGLAVSFLLALVTWRETRARALAAGWLARERAARNAAEQASLIKDEFLATLSHELRTPLNAILGWAHVVQSGQAGPEQVRTGLDAIERNARIQVRLIDELLDMSRIVSGKLKLDLQTVDFAQIVKSSVQSFVPAAGQKGVRLEAHLVSAAEVRGDSARLQQVVSNLLANAVKFTPEGGAIEVELEVERGEVRLSVGDTGIGIDPEFLPYVFERFRQGDATRTRRHGGLGLGLAIVRQLVDLHGGTVTARSKGPGEGACFAVTLPRAEAAVAGFTTAAATEAAIAEAAREDFSGIRVLVVDDEPDARELVRYVMHEHRAEVAVAASAHDALAVLETFMPHILLSDIGMPGMDGYELIRRIRRRIALRAIAISAYARTEDRRRALDAGYDAYLVKPLHPASLVAAVAKLVADIHADMAQGPSADIHAAP